MMSETAEGAIDYLREAGKDARWENTGGGIMCIMVTTGPNEEDEVTVGTASGNWGWSDFYGDRWGEWEDLPESCDGDELAVRILGVLSDLKKEAR